MTNYLPTLKLFTETPTLSNYPTVATVVSSSLPLAAVFNGQLQLTQEVTKIMNARQKISFQPFQQYWDFKMYKVIKPKIIYSVYISRVLPDNAGTNKNSFYYPSVQFRIDYDPCCIGSMVLYYTMAISARQLLSAIKVNINGYQATGNQLGISVSSDKLTIQYAYANYFPYLHINTIQLGFANTGGQATNIHQEIPGEILYLYHTIFADPGYSEMCLRGARQDMFIIKHDPHSQYLPNVTFAIKNPAVIQNNISYADKTYTMKQDQSINSVDYELAMLVNPNQITGADVSSNSNPQFASKTKMVCYFDDIFQLDSKVAIESPGSDKTYIEKLFMSGQAKWKIDWANVDFGDNVLSSVNKQFYENKTQLQIRAQSDDQLNKIDIQSTGAFGIGLRVYDSSRDPLKLAVESLTGTKDQSYLQPFFQQNTPICSYVKNGVTFSLWQYIVYTGINYRFILFQSARLPVGVATPISATGSLDFTLGQKVTLSTEVIASQIKINKDATLANMKPGVEYVAIDTADLIQHGVIMCQINCDQQYSAAGYKAYPPKTALGEQGDAAVNSIFNSLYIVDPNNQSNPESILSFMSQTASMVGLKIYQLTGGIDPLLRVGKISNIQIDQKYYRSNDFNISSIAALYDTTSGKMDPTSKNIPNWQTLRYNAAIACNAPNEERNPSIYNPDCISIHTYRAAHGEVDFSINLNCLFICNGIENSFPHYACSAQSIIIKILFNNPLSYINTSVSCPAREIDPLDTSDNERILVNRIKVDNILQCDSGVMNFTLFYSRIAWVPTLIAILTNYQYYSWVQDNYEKFYKLYDRVTAGSEYTAMELTRSNFYTRAYMWVVNQETIISSMADGNVNYDYGIPLFNQKFEMPIFDMVNYETQYQSQSGFTNYTGSDLNSQESQSKNSVMNLCPIAGIQMKTNTKINMCDNIPWRQAMFQSYLMLEHDVVNSAYRSNNMVQFDINPVYSSKAGEFPYCMYSPAFAPTVWLCIFTRASQIMPFGTITIAQCKNVSYIDKHIMLLKYATNQ